jgi:hypothetical protein
VADLSVVTRTTSRLFCFPSLEQGLVIGNDLLGQRVDLNKNIAKQALSLLNIPSITQCGNYFISCCGSRARTELTESKWLHA